MGLSIQLHAQPSGQPMTVGCLRSFLEHLHDDVQVKIECGGKMQDIEALRHITTSPGDPIIRLLVAVD